MIQVRTIAWLLVAAIVSTGCVSLVGTGVAGGWPRTDSRSAEDQQMDVRITNRINAAYVSDPQIPAMEIRVNSQRGIVTLQGTVPSDTVRGRALRVAESTREVRRVVDRLRVAR